MTQPTGFYLPLSLPRRLMNDFLHFSSKVPSVPVERRMNLAPLIPAREGATPRPSWCSIFTKAWGFACAAHPPLRRAYISFPWPRLYQHPISVATVAVEKPYGGDDGVFFMHFTQPDKQSLFEIDRRIKWFKDRPLDSAATFVRQMRLARMPLPLRRLIWWISLNLSGRMRARFLGTYGVTSYSGLGATSLHPRGLLTSTLTYGPIAADGSVSVRIVYDHRTLDGGTVARALADMERAMLNEILAELRYMEAVEAA